MDKFRDVPCDFADASLLVTNTTAVFTLDGHFMLTGSRAVL